MSRTRPNNASKTGKGVVLNSMRRAELDDEISKILKSRRRAPLRARRASTQEITVADDKSKTGNPDRQRINPSQEHELRDWATKFGVSEDMLRTAVTQVGNQATDVERYLKDKAKR